MEVFGVSIPIQISTKIQEKKYRLRALNQFSIIAVRNKDLYIIQVQVFRRKCHLFTSTS